MQTSAAWQACLLNPDASILTAIEVLDKTALGIVLVVDAAQQLLGTITDGDIRRALIRQVGINASVQYCMNHSPTTMLGSESKQNILRIMQEKQFYQMPLVDENGALIGLETLQHLLKRRYYDNPVFLMAGGFGTRLRPLTDNTPKPLLKIGDKPILQTILEQFVEAGFYNFYISTHFQAEKIQAHFGNGEQWRININYVHEERPLGTAGALSLLPKDLSDLPIIMMNGDILTKVDLAQLLQYHQAHQGIATMCVREYDFQIPYGVIKSGENEHYIQDIEEKPIQKMFVNAGIYVLEAKLLQQVKANTKLDMPTLLQHQINEGNAVSMFPIHEYWLDIGQFPEFEQANKDYLSLFVSTK